MYFYCRILLCVFFVCRGSILAYAEEGKPVSTDIKVLRALQKKQEEQARAAAKKTSLDPKAKARSKIREDLAREQKKEIEASARLVVKPPTKKAPSLSQEAVSPKNISPLQINQNTGFEHIMGGMGGVNPFNPYYYQVMEKLKREKSFQKQKDLQSSFDPLGALKAKRLRTQQHTARNFSE